MPEADGEMQGREGDLDRLMATVQAHANDSAGEAVMVTNAIICWEETMYDDEGVLMRRVKYTIPGDNWGMAASLGLLEAAREYVRWDILGERPRD